MSISASAPGKVVLSGEYAVLNGAPAICMAVDRRAVAKVGSTNQSFEDSSSLIRSIMWAVGRDDNPVCDTQAFRNESGEKLGLGSSAALTVALLAAFDGHAPDLARAVELHREWQGGKGSGVDIACSLVGGVINYQIDGPQVTRLGWPEGLGYRLVWSGAPSSTGDKLRQLSDASPQASADRLASQARLVADAWSVGDAESLLGTYRDYIATLREFSVDHALGIFDAGHDEIVDAAIAANIVYKPCGAGGGDVGIALSMDEQALDVFVSDLGLQLVDCRLDPTGVVLDTA